ncbi:DUF6214 family protein [Streptomyces rhizoryzae]|uniref:DUF6214 family protein n=1 Tax=Streptomyces rhizoryzae TaxID=2932493 RepID=UPI00249E69C4
MEWPDWELRAHGSAASGLGPWFSARLTFPHGARIDVLVTASGDHLTVEDVRADPPLTLDALATLAHWIEGPLDDACRAATGRPPKTRPTPAGPPRRRPGPAPTAPRPGGAPATAESPAEAEAPAAGAVRGEGALCAPGVAAASPAVDGVAEAPSTAAPEGALEVVQGEAPEGVPVGVSGEASGEAPAGGSGAGSGTGPGPGADSGTGSGTGSGPCAGSGDEASPDGDTPPPTAPSAPPATPTPAAGVRSAVLVRSRAGERRRVAAAAYRAAQKEGRDPVLAVMDATGRNRRRALRLIAGARDAGLLTPRHNKR